MGMFKKGLALAICALGLFAEANAQRTEVYRSSQARLIEPQMGVYIKPLAADLEIDQTKGKVKDVWEFTPDEVAAMGGDEADVRTRALFMSVDKHDVDVIVAASFDLESTNSGSKVTVIGYPAKYVNWRTASPADNEWIRNEILKPEKESEETQAISK